MANSVMHFIPNAAMGFHRFPDCQIAIDGLEEFSIEQAKERGAKSLVLGLVNNGGYIEDAWLPAIEAAIYAGLDIISGMHTKLDECMGPSGRSLRELASDRGVQLHNLRHHDGPLSVGTGLKRAGTRVLMVGTDCGSGKMFTAITLTRALQAAGKNAQFVATGQCGILVAGSGIAIDAVGADFISGAVETMTPATSGIQVIEGQGSLFHPAYAGVSLGLLHGAQPDYLIVCHESGRDQMINFTQPLPSIADTIARNVALARDTNPHCQCVGISLNTASLTEGDALSQIAILEQKHHMPVTDPYRFGVEKFLKRLGVETDQDRL